ncbi:hypothetical protein [Pseudoalteromonas phenolica]|uniref:hypothetical protein n=1 Tax=Pseudoalteromonas phenolica TaxID=161398 RepID=UPI00110A2B00|nr:hypothetical protein [Pseudoalteromonas phenolica]TMO57115.1 hypothetical protein CWC21_04310 [Pseudoalteromonas phenolica]
MKEENIPNWWKQAIAIEYLPCRDYLKGDRLSQFDFSLVTKEQLEEAINKYKIVSYGKVIHNVDPRTFQQKRMLGLLGGVTKPIVEGDSAAIIPNGIVSKIHFPNLVNPIDVCDPLETFNSHIQVLDEGILYQWEIARFEGVKDRHYGRWVSDYVDLSAFDEDHDEFQELCFLKQQTKNNPEEYVERARCYIEKIQSLRLGVFKQLLEIHNEFKMSDRTSKKKVVDYPPPLLSHFETMKIEDGEISTKASMAPIFYRSALKHRLQAKKLQSPNEKYSIHIFDEIHQERAEAIIMAAACLEAVVNEVGDTKHKEIWSGVEKLSLNEKYKTVFYLSGKPDDFDISKSPFQFLNKLISVRNEMIHFKPGYKRVKVLNGKSTSRLDTLLDIELIDKLPMILCDSINALYKVADSPLPEWLSDKPGWKLSEDT